MSAHAPRVESLETRTLLAAPAGHDLSHIQVMTQNLYMGTDLQIVMGVSSAAQVPSAVSQTWDMMKASNFPARAESLAQDIAHAGPALVGLQEASLWMSQSASGTETCDYVQLLTDALAQHGVSYTPVAAIVDVAAQLPDDRGDLVTFADRDVILARTDLLLAGQLRLANVQSGNYATRFSVPIADTGVSIDIVRGWASVDATADGQTFRFVNTHLESYVPLVQLGQAAELVAGPANTTLPVLVAGDFNSDAYGGAFGGPDVTPTYGYLLANGFQDTWAQTHNHLPGLTWGQADDLRNIKSTVSERIDFIFTRGAAEAERSYLTDCNPGDRTRTEPRLWGSDHAGLVASIDVGAPTSGAAPAPATGADWPFQSKRLIADTKTLAEGLLV